VFLERGSLFFFLGWVNKHLKKEELTPFSPHVMGFQTNKTGASFSHHQTPKNPPPLKTIFSSLTKKLNTLLF